MPGLLLVLFGVFVVNVIVVGAGIVVVDDGDDVGWQRKGGSDDGDDGDDVGWQRKGGGR